MRRKLRARRWHAAMMIATLSASSQQAGASSLVASWVGTAGNWTDPANWSTSPSFPNNGAGNNYDAIINKMTALVTLDAPIGIDHFVLNSGKLIGDSSLTLNDGGTWSGGDISGAGTINVSNFLQINGGGHGLSNYTFNTQANTTVTWTSGDIHSVDDEGGVFNNAGTFIDQADDNWSWGVSQSPTFNNSGIYIKSAGTAGVFKEIQPAFNNSGTVDVRAGTLYLDGGGDSTGTFLVSAGQTLAVSDFEAALGGSGAPTTTWESSSVVESDGTVHFRNYGAPFDPVANTDIFGSYRSALTIIDPGDGGEVSFDFGAVIDSARPGDWQVYSGELQFNTGNVVYMNGLDIEGGEMGGSDDRVAQTAMTWNGGVISGAGNTYATDGLDIGTDSVKQLRFAGLLNQPASTASWSGGTILLTNSTIYNNGGLFDAQFDGTIENALPAAQAAFVNSSTFIKSAGTGSTNLDNIEFFNSGTVDVQSGTLRLGGGGDQTGTFLIESGATLELAGTSFDAFPSPHVFESGSVVSGPGDSTLHITGSTTFLAGATVDVGELLVEGPLLNEGSITSNIGNIDNGGQVVLVNSASWSNANQVNVGIFSSGTLVVEPGSTVSSEFGVLSLQGGSGTVILTGAGARWDLSQFIQIGGTGAATLVIDGGAVLTDTVGDTGGVFAATGSATITVQNSGQWINSSFLRVGSLGHTTFTIASGGQVSNTVGDVASAVGSSAAVNVTGAGSKWINSDYLAIGNQGNASMSISAGAAVQSSVGIIGSATTGVGSLLVTGAGSHYIDASFLSVGDQGTGSLTIQSAGTVSCTDLLVGDQTGGVGTLAIDGANSSLAVSNNTVIGNVGHGTLSVINGAHLNSSLLGYVGSSGGAVGNATVSGAGSRWDMQTQLAVGVIGSGTLTISNGGVVTCKMGTSVTGSDAVIGRLGAGVGTILVTGPGSQLNCLDGHLNVGFGSLASTDTPGGIGTLIVTGGGAVTSVNGYIGRTVGGVGTANLGGGAGTSSWTMTGSLFVGGDDNVAAPGGAGTLIVSSGGLLIAPTKIKAWNNGTILWNGGSISTAALELTGGGKMLLTTTASPKLLHVNSLSIDVAGGSKLNLDAESAIIDYTGSSPIGSIRSALISGRNNGAWNGAGIASSHAAANSTSAHPTALGYAEASALGINTFHTQPVDTTAIVMGYVYAGDANLDGQVTNADFTRLAQNFNGAGKLWSDGDFNYDGKVNALDFNFIASNFGQPAITSPALGSLVPEPTGGLALGVAVWMHRRRRKTATRISMAI